jgi:hypothetical protein
MSRPKTVKSKSHPRTPVAESKTSVNSKSAAKTAAPESTPDQKAQPEHRAQAHRGPPAKDNPWSEWLWCEEGQMMYRGRKDSKGSPALSSNSKIQIFDE